MKKLRKLVSLVVSAALLLGAAVLPTGTEVYAAENVPPEIDTIDTQEETAYMEQADEPPRETGAEQADEPPRETGAEQADEPPRETGAEQADEPPRETGAEQTDAVMALRDILTGKTVMALVYLSDVYPVRAQGSYESETVVTVPSGQQVQIQDIYRDETGEVWAYVLLYYRETRYCGYLPRRNLACSDEVFLEWEEAYQMKPETAGAKPLRRGAAVFEDVQQFPESYRTYLNALKNAHPNWTFVPFHTQLDWNTVVRNELEDGRSLIESYFPAYMRDGSYGPGWDYASEGGLKYYLDPRNWLSEETAFQFELLTYNASYHTEEAVQAFLNGTFMSGQIPGEGRTYANAFWEIGQSLGVSPFHLACRVYQEQGGGTSPLISGTYGGYEGYYNFFNIGASGQTDQAVFESGLAKAKAAGWNSRYKALLGGAEILSANYILKGQDTLYLQKFDVDNSANGLYWHQYMQNICAPSSEGKNIRKSYVNAGALENTFVFKIPVYLNMPEAASAKPTYSYDVALVPPESYRQAYQRKPSLAAIYLDGVEYRATLRNGRYVVAAPGAEAKTAVMYAYSETDVPVGMYVWTLSYSDGAYTATAVPELENLLSYHGFSIRIVGNSGIRFKTGISTDLRARLTSGTVAGYQLKEYGTLVMNNANRGTYPLVKGGEKVASGRSYGIDGDQVLEDKIYETTGGRYRFTSVLVNLPVSQYRTEFAFRGYIVLQKGQTEITLYGPAVWRSIDSLAQQVLTGGQYAKDSAADQFLRKLVADAEKLEG